MNKNKASENAMKKDNTKSNLFINFLLLIKQFFYYFAYSLSLIFVVATTTNAAFYADETFIQRLTPLNFLEQHRDLPVEYLSVIYMADIDLQHELFKEASHPLFSVLEAKKKLSLARKSIHPFVTYTDLNDFITPLKGAEYINNRRMFPLSQIPLFSWLLKEYGPCYYQDKSGTTSLVTITIDGMLYDIQRRAKNDPVAKLVLAFLNHPYTKSIRLKSTDYQSWFIRYSPYLSWLFTPEQTEPTFSEKLTLLIDSPYTEEQIRNNRLIDLSKKGYKYKKDYNFISHEIDENGKEKFVSSDEIILPETKSQKLLDDDYPVLSKPGDKLVLKTGLKVATLLTAGLSLFPAASAYNTPAPPPPQCNIQSKCLGGAHLLNNVNIAWRLLGFSSGCFELTENITLNQQYNLPFFKDCNNPFSGELKTGPYSIQTGNSISPIFGCINQTTITGNINLCAHNSALTSPVIAEQALHENILTIQQTDNCEAQYPLLGSIIGDYNQITFTGTSGKVSTGSGTGIIASHVSGSHNSIRIQNSELYNTSITTVAGGNNNTYHQQDLNITKFTDHKLPDNKLLAANFFTGDKTTIVQQNIDARLIVSPPYSPHQNIQKNQNSAVNIFSADTFTQIDLTPETVRITNASDNSMQRSVMQNNGRFEIYRNNKWLPVCESTLHQKIAHAACKSLGYIEAKDEGARINLHERLNTTRLSSNPVHINRECTGYEYHLEQCGKTNTDTGACRQNREALLSCTNNPFVYKTDLPLRLTDHTSNDTYRFDTTNIGAGRLEYKSNDTYMTVCKHKFNAANANAACYQMGFNGGESVSLQQVPLNTANQLPLQWQCTNSEQNLTACSSSAFNPASFGCTHADDVILKCGRSGFSTDGLVPVNFRLTDRHSNDASRAILTQTGFGRLEVLFKLPSSIRHRFDFKYVGFCSEDVLDSNLQLICKAIGFDKGRKSYLTGKLLPLLNDNNRRNLFECRHNNANTCVAYEAPFTNFYRYLTPCKNDVVIECTHSNSTALQLIPKVCSETQKSDITLFSGSYNYGVTTCNPDSCPLKSWDIYSTQISDNLDRPCSKHIKRQPSHWRELWEERCNAVMNYCNSCHLPYEEALGLVADNEHGETLLISRQSYSDRYKFNSLKPILVNRFSPGNIPRIFSRKTHPLAADVCAVNHILNEQLLVGLYSTNNGTGSQLLWISLENSNRQYDIKDLSLDGRNLLLLTNDSIFLQDTNNTTIKQYPLHRMINENNRQVTFHIDYSDYQEINLPRETDNILAASLKNNQLHLATTSIHGKTYLASTDGRSEDDVYVVSYNISDKSWSCITELTDGITADNIHGYSMVVNDDNQVQFLAREPISIPKSGGCISLAMKISAAPKSFRLIRSLEDEQQLNNDTNSVQASDSEQSSGDEVFAMLTAIPVAFVVSTIGGYLLNCAIKRGDKSSDSSNEQEYKYSDNYHWNDSLEQKDPVDSHYYDKCKPTPGYKKSSNNTYYLARGEEGQYAEYTVIPDKNAEGYIISKNKKQQSQCSGEQYHLVNNLTKQQENKEYITLEDTTGLLTSNSGAEQIHCKTDINKLPGHSVGAADYEIANNHHNQGNTASHYKINDKDNRPVRLKVVDLYDVSHPPKVSSESTKLSAQQENKIIYDVINEPGDGYSDTEETDHNKTYNSKIFQETTV